MKSSDVRPLSSASGSAPPIPIESTNDLQRPLHLQKIRPLPFLRRFHIRVSTLYGGLVFLVLAVMGSAFYVIGVEAQMLVLQGRLRTAAIGIAHQIKAEKVMRLNTEADQAKPEYAELIELFRSIGRDEPQLVSIYVLRQTGRPNFLFFAADYVRSGDVPPAKVGEEYDARQAQRMMSAFVGPAVDDRITVDKWGPVLSGYAPIRQPDGTAVAIVGVDVSATDVTQLKSNVRMVTFSALGFAAASIVLLTFFVGRIVRNPIAHLTAATTNIAAGKLDTRVGIERSDEFGLLVQHLDAMAAGLAEREHVRAVFGRYVSKEVASRILSSREGATLGGEERIVTILFSDLAQYSTMSEKLSPADVVRMLNVYFSLMTEIIDQHQGCVIEFLGDALLCVFGAPNALPDHAEQALLCAIAMRAKLAEVNQEWAAPGTAKLWQNQGSSTLRMRIGIHTGEVIAGNIGSNSRIKYAVIGDSVNVASRVEQLNKELGTDILVTENTLMRVPDALRRQTTPCGEFAIKGRLHTIQVHKV